MHLIRTAQPASEPVVLADAKLHARVDITDDDALITALITVARQWVENFCINSLITQSYTVTYDYRDKTIGAEWMAKRYIRLPQSPVQSIATITTYDMYDNATVFDASNYRLSGDRVVLDDLSWWPTELRLYDALQIDFVAGYGSGASSVPSGIILAMKMLIATWYENRESITDDVLARTSFEALPVPFGVRALLTPYRVFTL